MLGWDPPETWSQGWQLFGLGWSLGADWICGAWASGGFPKPPETKQCEKMIKKKPFDPLKQPEKRPFFKRTLNGIQP